MQSDLIEKILQTIPIGVLSVDLHQKIVFYNHSILEILGKGSLKPSPQLNLIEWVRIPEVLQSFRQTLETGQHTQCAHLPIVNPLDESDRFFTLNVNPILDASGTVRGAVGIFQDITEHRAAEQIRMDFVANVSHELRTPLTSIKGYMETLLDDVQSGRPIEMSFLESIQRNTQRLLLLMEDLLDLSALESARSKLVKSWHSTREITEATTRLYVNSIPSKKRIVSTIYNAERVYCDASRLDQVISNLLENAIKYTPEGTQIRIQWSENPLETILTIEDSGPGIPAEHLPRLFERFYRIDRGRSREQGGTGLGLAIVKHIMQRHGGSVSVESTLGIGTSFTCRFPKPMP